MQVVKEAGEHHAAGRFTEAAHLYETLLGANPTDPIILYLYGTLNSQRSEFGTAIVKLWASTQLGGDEIPEVWHNLGVAYRNEGHNDKARESYQKCLDLEPERADTLAMMAGSYINVGQPEKAIEWADKALAIEDTPHARNHKALASLELGRWADGWRDYESRFELPTFSAMARPYECPRWDGKAVKKLAIHGEQGIGDEIMFMSCFYEAFDLADEVVIECADRLVPLFKRAFNVQCYGTHNALVADNPDIDAYIPMGSLPGLFRRRDSDFPRRPYLTADDALVTEFKRKLGDGMKIGIAWHGGTKGTHQELRNASLTHWQSLIDNNKDKTFISLQYGQDGPMQAQEMGIMHWQDAIDDFEQQAALIASCDLVVSVCQTAIHMAGALGVPCWCLTPDHAAWRYGVQGPMLWYPETLELIRQDGAGWDGVFETVGNRLDDIDY